MKINIDGKEYTITDDVIKSAINLLEKIALLFYDQMSTPTQMLVVAYARKDLYDREKAEPDKKEKFRPEKREDPTKRLMSIMCDEIVEMIRKQEFGVRTNASNEIIAIEFKSASAGGGQMVISRNEREWENYGRQVS